VTSGQRVGKDGGGDGGGAIVTTACLVFVMPGTDLRPVPLLIQIRPAICPAGAVQLAHATVVNNTPRVPAAIATP
jgi:hypothetical protein